jgi:hypothetical protein
VPVKGGASCSACFNSVLEALQKRAAEGDHPLFRKLVSALKWPLRQAAFEQPHGELRRAFVTTPSKATMLLIRSTSRLSIASFTVALFHHLRAVSVSGNSSNTNSMDCTRRFFGAAVASFGVGCLRKPSKTTVIWRDE